MYIIEKEKRYKINNLSFHLRTLQKDEWIKPKANRGKVVKINMEINETENRKKEKIRQKLCYLKIKINKHLGRVTKNERELT